MTQKGYLTKHIPEDPTKLITWSVVPGEHVWHRRGRAKGSTVKRKPGPVSQVVTEERKIMRALPGGLTINAAGYVLTIGEAKELYKALKELFE